ncbi:MAG: PQQ-binding-like beta-propeller repeat protein [Acidimicrobiia bacterium]|nr:PQQ-binding-like beta-propeller repeat protein [Acidimicrobiia bacterium]
MRRVLASLVFVLAACTASAPPDETPTTAAPTSPPSTTVAVTTSVAPPTQAPTTTQAATTTTVVQPAPPGGFGVVEGLTMFRGNPTRTFYGTGPIPKSPEVLWRFPDEPMCSVSRLAGEDKVWCGSGWTGQPVVWERPDGVTEVIVGAYDQRVHFLDAATGERTRPDFFVGDIIKGSVVLDPDGYPLLYVGSRVSRYMVVALDRPEPVELWGLRSDSVDGIWNNDWDSSPAIVDGYLIEGGENSHFFAVKLNRDYDQDGLVKITPEVVAAIPSWTDELLAAVGTQQSIESSPAVFDSVAYVGTGAGRVMGVGLEDLESGSAEIVFDFWAGDDIDSTIVIDAEGMLYVAPQVDLQTRRAAEVGQLIKLDPSRPHSPLIWSLAIPSEGGAVGGAWATPALHAGHLYVPTNPGELLVVDTESGDVVWSDDVGFHAWSSPLVIDETLIVAVNCGTVPALRAYDLADPRQPALEWEVPISAGCLESTPAMWNGRIYVGSRDGYFYAVGDR